MNPFVPSSTPAIVVDVGSPISNVDDLCLEPLVDGVLNIHPLSDSEHSLRDVEARDILRRLVPLDSNERNSLAEQRLQCDYVLSDHLRALSCIQPDVGQQASGYPLEAEPSVSSHMGLFTQCLQDETRQIKACTFLVRTRVRHFFWFLCLDQSIGNQLHHNVILDAALC